MGYLYLFTALAGSSCPPSGCLEPSAGEVRVAYNFTLTRCHLTSPVLLYIRLCQNMLKNDRAMGPMVLGCIMTL